MTLVRQVHGDDGPSLQIKFLNRPWDCEGHAHDWDDDLLKEHEKNDVHNQAFLSQHQDDLYRVTKSLPDVIC